MQAHKFRLQWSIALPYKAVRNPVESAKISPPLQHRTCKVTAGKDDASHSTQATHTPFAFTREQAFEAKEHSLTFYLQGPCNKGSDGLLLSMRRQNYRHQSVRGHIFCTGRSNKRLRT